MIVCWAATVAMATPAMAHDCRVKDGYLVGWYEGDCNEKIELAEGKGSAKGANSYEGDFVKGRPDGKGVYVWEDGARLDGSFKEGKAHGAGVFVSANGVRYEGQFVNGKLPAMKSADCPNVPAPVLAC